MDSRRLHPQRPPAHNYDARPQQQGLDPYLSAQNRAPQYQDQIPSRREVYGGGFRSVGDQPPSPIAFAVREPYPNASTNDVSYLAPNAAPQRERTANTQPHTRQHAFLDEPPPAGFPAKNHPGDSGAKSTFSADDDHSVSNRSRTSSGGKKILKRMMKELAGGPKEPTPPLDGNPLSPKQEKVMAYGRGGAGRVKKKPSATLAEKSKSSASIASSDDMKTLKSASSSAAKKNGKVVSDVSVAKKTGKVVYDPYLKTMVGTRGITVPPAAGPTVTATIPPPLSSASSSTPQSPDSYAYSSSKFTSISGSSRTDPSLVGSIARPPSSRSGWDDESIISDAWASGRSRDHYTSPPPSAFTYSSSRTDPQGYPSPPPSEGRAPSAWKSHHGIQRRSSDLSLRAGNGAPPILDPTQLLIHSLLQQQQPAGSAVPLPALPPQPTQTPDLATTLYAALLAQQTAIHPPAPSIQQPIIPPQLASNLDSIIAAATAYSQLLAAATGAGVGPVAPAQPELPTPPVAIPNNPPGKGKDDVGALNAALASYSLSTPSTAASSPSSVSALSPPPRHKQLRKGTPTGSHGPTPPRRSSSPHTAPDEPKQPSVDDSAWSRRKGQFQNLVTPPATDDGQTNISSSLTVDGNPGSLASNVSFSSSLTPSPAPSTVTFAQAPPPELVQAAKGGRAQDRRPSRDEPFYRSAPVPALTPSASSSSLSQASAFLDAPVSAAGRNRSNTTSQESFSSTRSNISDKDQVSKAEKELLKLEKSLQSFRTLSSENMQKQYSAGRAPSRAAEAPRDTPIASADRTRVLPPAKQPPPSSAGAALSANANNPRRPRRVSVTETDEEYYRRMHLALPPLPSAPSPVSHVNRSRKDSSATSTTTTTSSSSQSLPRGVHAAPAPNFSTRPSQLELENPLSSYGRHAMPTRGGPSAEALASRQPSTWKSNGVDPSARLSVQSPTLTEMDFPMPPSSITVRPGAGGSVRPGPRKESLLASSTARPRRDYI